MANDPNPPILISGAGPTGLYLALILTTLKVPVMIIDKALTSGTTSRAIVVHARTIEYYSRIPGLAEELISRGMKVGCLNFRREGIIRGSVPVGEIGTGVSRYPFILTIPQDVHEYILEEKLASMGVKVRRGVTLISAEEVDDKVNIKLQDTTGTEELIKANYVAGCDGAHSAVRHAAGLKMEGGTYAGRFFVADVDAEGEKSWHSVNICTAGSGFCIFIPLRRVGGARIIGTVPKDLEDREEDISFEDVRASVLRNTKLEVTKVQWFATYKVHHRLADKFRLGKFFLLGDAGHLHSPAGGQGMNTGLGDSANLAWKVVEAIRNPSNPAIDELLDTYEAERRSFAKLLVATTDQAFTTITNTGIPGWFVRSVVMPIIAPFAVRNIPGVPLMMFMRVSQTAITYRGLSSLAENKSKIATANTVQAGDRLPWVKIDDEMDNYKKLESHWWQAHVYGDIIEEVKKELSTKEDLPLYTSPWEGTNAEAQGLRKDAIYLVRPDGHIGMVCDATEVGLLKEYLERWGIALQ